MVNSNASPPLPATREEYRVWYAANIPEGVEWGECWCGCQEKVPLSNGTKPLAFRFRDEQARFCKGHHPRLDERYRVEERGHKTPCWIWCKSITPKGYGVKRLTKNRLILAHRWMWEREHPPVAHHLAEQLHHDCLQPSCVNPSHLSLLSFADHRRQHGKLTTKKAREVRRCWQDGESIASLSERMGVTPRSIYHVLERETWVE